MIYLYPVLAEFEKIVKNIKYENKKIGVVKKRLSYNEINNTKNFPLISIYETDFSFIENSITNNLDYEFEERIEKFSGDGKTCAFELKEQPFKSVFPTEVKYKDGNNNNNNNITGFDIDYTEKLIKFDNPPKKGNANFYIKYYIKPERFTRKIEVQMNIHLEIFHTDHKELDRLFFLVIETIIASRLDLSKKKVQVKLLGGINIKNSNIEYMNSIKDTIYGKSLNCKVNYNTGLQDRDLEIIKRINITTD